MVSYLILVLASCVAYLQFGYADVIKVDEAQKREAVDTHNEWRQKAGATAMRKLKWNADLAAFAERAAALCNFAHTSSESRKQKVGGFDYIGENIYANTGKPTYKQAVDSWGSEEKDYNLATDQCTPGAMCGHYTQINWAKTSEVGCAMAQCAKVEGWGPAGYILFCNYGVGGNMKGQKPFEKGTPGSQCQVQFGMAAGGDGLCGEKTREVIADTDSKEEVAASTQAPEIQPGTPAYSNTESQNGFATTEAQTEESSSQKQTEDDDDSECKDKLWYCRDWTSHCGRDWTYRYCQKTCNLCGKSPDHGGQNGQGEQQAALMKKDPSMDSYIDVSGGQEAKCEDDISYCNHWLDSCNQAWAKHACKKSCKHC